jgi:hypothetical protein
VVSDRGSAGGCAGAKRLNSGACRHRPAGLPGGIAAVNNGPFLARRAPEALLMELDRRNSRPRAEAARRVLERIVSSPVTPVSCDELAMATGITVTAAMRIVRKLAMRMLVRNIAPGRWVPTPVLSRYPALLPGG